MFRPNPNMIRKGVHTLKDNMVDFEILNTEVRNIQNRLNLLEINQIKIEGESKNFAVKHGLTFGVMFTSGALFTRVILERYF
jgi:hypothetical protein